MLKERDADAKTFAYAVWRTSLDQADEHKSGVEDGAGRARPRRCHSASVNARFRLS
jgi:hypothetical protein